MTRRKIKLFRIVALKDIPSIGVVKGERGGLVHSEYNLSQDGDCWIYYSACVYDQARVSEDAQIEDSAQVFEHACIYGSSIVSDNTIVCGHSKVYESAVISDFARVSGNAKINGNAQIYHNAHVYGDAIVSKYAEVYGSSVVHENAYISGNAEIDDSTVRGDVHVSGDAYLFDNTIISGNVVIDCPFNFSSTEIHSEKDFSVLKFEKFDSFVSYFSGNDIIYVRTNFANYYFPDLEEGHTTLLREDLEYTIRKHFSNPNISLRRHKEYEELKQKALSLIALNELKMQSIKKEIIK
ncbi:glucosamine N-acyltransferase [Bacillus phage vB_BauM_KLEB27-3]|nr:glucosamine N-acyltransferase [Bacillus phage vB_BauM_KLEB27-3]